ncbi:hypothetical protein J6590_027685 [Homalodisca vitripennis]|nr:hypothetical protein J6590_027685 [Homalodisca vitripennis]
MSTSDVKYYRIAGAWGALHVKGHDPGADVLKLPSCVSQFGRFLCLLSRTGEHPIVYVSKVKYLPFRQPFSILARKYLSGPDSSRVAGKCLFLEGLIMSLVHLCHISDVSQLLITRLSEKRKKRNEITPAVQIDRQTDVLWINVPHSSPCTVSPGAVVHTVSVLTADTALSTSLRAQTLRRVTFCVPGPGRGPPHLPWERLLFNSPGKCAYLTKTLSCNSTAPVRCRHPGPGLSTWHQPICLSLPSLHNQAL